MQRLGNIGVSGSSEWMAKYAAGSSKPPVTNYLSIGSLFQKTVTFTLSHFNVLHFFHYYYYYCPISAFAKFRKATVSFAMSVHMEQFQLSLD